MAEENLQLGFQVGAEDFEPELKFYSVRITGMHEVYGKCKMPGKTCKTCVHCRSIDYKRSYYQCEICKQPHSMDISWHTGWDACGKYEE